MILRYLGFAEESEFNVDPAPEATYHVDIASSSLDTPNDTEIIYGGGLGRGIRTHRPGFYAPSGSFEYAMDIRTIAFLLKWALGGYEFTEAGGTGDLNLHEIYGTHDNILDSFCARVGKDYFEHVFSGCVINSISIEVDGEFCKVTADINAAKDSKDTIKKISELTLPEEYPLAFHEVTASLGEDTDFYVKVKKLTLTIGNGLSAAAGKGIGSRHPYYIPAGEREVSLTADLRFEDTTEIERYWGATDGPDADGTTEFSLTLNFDAGTDGSMVVSLPKVIYNQVNQQPSGRDEIVQSVACKAFMDTITLDDGVTEVDSEILVTIENNQDEITVEGS